MHFRKGRDLSRPVVLLQIDIDRIIAAPRGQEFLIPETLQVGRDTRRPRGGDQQIASILEIEDLQFRIDVQAVRIAAQLHVRRQGGDVGIGLPEIQRDPVEKRLVIRDVGLAQGLVILRRSALHDAPGFRDIILALGRRVLERAVETRGIGDQKRHVMAAAQDQGFAVKGDVSVRRDGAEQGLEMNAALRIIEEMVHALRFVVIGIGMIGRIAAQGHARSAVLRHGVRKRALQADLGPDAGGVRDPDHDDRIRRGHEILPLLTAAGAFHTDGSRGIRNVQHAAVAGNGGFVSVLIVDQKRPQRLVILAVMALDVVEQLVREPVVLGIQRLADGRDPIPVRELAQFAAAGIILGPGLTFAGPERDVIEGNAVLLYAAIHHGTQTSVAQGKRFFEEGRRTVIMQAELLPRAGGVLTGAEKESENQEKKGLFHSYPDKK